MDVWLKKGRPALFNALTMVCDQIGRDIQAAEQCRQDHETEIESEKTTSLRKNLADSDGAEENYRQLLAQIQKALIPPTPATDHGAGLESALRPIDDGTRSKRDRTKTDDWKLSHAKLEKKHQLLKDKYRQITARLRRVFESRGKWIEYADSRDEYIRELENGHGNFSSTKRQEEALFEEEGRLGKAETGKLKVKRPIYSPNVSFVAGDAEETVISPLPAIPHLPEAVGPLGALQSDSETVMAGVRDDENDDDNELPKLVLPGIPPEDKKSDLLPQLKPEPSSDGPIFVSERVVSKRRRHQADLPSPPRRMKLKHSSSPLGIGERHSFIPQESMDLDEVDSKFRTPKKQRGHVLEEYEYCSSPRAEDAQCQLSQTSPSNLTPRIPLPETGALNAIKEMRPENIARRAQEGSRANPKKYSLANTTNTTSSVLQPVSLNTRLTPNRRIWLDRKGLLGDEESCLQIKHYYSDEHTSKKRKLSRTDGLGETDVQAASPLSSLLKGMPSPSGEDIRATRTSRKTLPLSKANHCAHNPADAPALAPAPTPVPDQAAPLIKNHSSLKAGLNNTAARSVDSISPHGKNLSQLCPEDFKVNPSFNDGQNFAYAEVVRNRNERAQLPGCLDPSCCGREFRAMARAERGDRPRTLAQIEAETATLKAYLGDDAGKLQDMDDAEREQLWVEARARELSNRLGKHRHRYSRQRSPPGFWNADFPSTQELKEERAEAKRRERQTVMERYREAMRPGGRYTFRDR